MSITTSLRTIPMPDLSATPLTPSEPEVLRRERAALREILRLVAERAALEAEVEGTRASNDAMALRSVRSFVYFSAPGVFSSPWM